MAGDLQEIASFKWTSAREAAAGFVAADELTDDEIAATLRISLRTLGYWKANPVFATRVAALVAEAREAARQQTIANKQVRVDRLAERADKIDRVFAARADQHSEVPGGATGLLVREPKIVKVYEVKNWRGDDDEDDERLLPTGGVIILHEYKVDTGTLAELRQIEKQAAQELGEWVEKKDTTLGATEKFIAAMMEWGTGGHDA